MEQSMTYMISYDVAPFLQPERFHAADEIALNPAIVPDSPGIYGWWFDDTITDVPLQDSLLVHGRRLLYVGIAPNGAQRTTGKRTLRDRLKNHCRGRIAQSTLRLTLTSLVGRELGLVVRRRPSGKTELAPGGEQRLSQWMAEHLRVAWLVHPQPWDLEDALIKSGPRLPLNIMGSTDPFARELKARRVAMAS
jgi:hypothetical protein